MMQTRKYYYLLVFCLLIFPLFQKQAHAQTDTEFWFGAPFHVEFDRGNRWLNKPIQLILYAEQAASVEISQPAGGGMPTTNVNIPANSYRIVDLTQWINVIQTTQDGMIRDYGIKIISTTPIKAHYRITSAHVNGNPEPYNLTPNPETYILKGKKALGKDFLIPIQNTFFNDTLRPYSSIPKNSFTIVATEDETKVTITPSSPIVGHPGGQPFTITLNEGQTYSATAIFASGDMHLTGSHVVSDKPIAISITDDVLYLFNGGDITGDQLLAQEHLGNTYIALNSLLYTSPTYTRPNLNGDQVFILATKNNTNIVLNGTQAATINAGEMYRVNMGSSNAVYIECSEPVSCVQLSGLFTQPGLAQIYPLGCSLGEGSIGYIRYMEGHILFNLVVQNGGESSFTLNGLPNIITAAMFDDVPGTNGTWKYCIYNLGDSLATRYPVNQPISINNTSSTFQLSIMEAGINPSGECWGADFGYYSDYSTSASLSSRNILGNDTGICLGDTIILDATTTNALRYKWNTGDTGSVLYAHSPGIYKVFIETISTCNIEDSIEISLFTLPKVDLGSDTSLCEGVTLELNLQFNPDFEYEWSTGGRTPKLSISEPGTYWVKVGTSTCGYVSDTILVNYNPCNCIFDAPTAFSPNGDGINDIFIPRFSSGCAITDYTFQVYNRWGKLIFSTTNPNEGWDGKYKGQIAELDVYGYLINFKHLHTDKTYNKKGDITLLK